MGTCVEECLMNTPYNLHDFLVETALRSDLARRLPSRPQDKPSSMPLPAIIFPLPLLLPHIPHIHYLCPPHFQITITKLARDTERH